MAYEPGYAFLRQAEYVLKSSSLEEERRSKRKERGKETAEKVSCPVSAQLKTKLAKSQNLKRNVSQRSIWRNAKRREQGKSRDREVTHTAIIDMCSDLTTDRYRSKGNVCIIQSSVLYRILVLRDSCVGSQYQ